MANVYFEPDATLPGNLQFVCRGPDGCGMPMTAEDRNRHARFHRGVSATVEDLDHLGGANDVPPLPPRNPQTQERKSEDTELSWP